MFCVSFEIDDLGGRQGDTAQARALVQWRHPVASSLALDVPHWVTLILVSPTTIGKDNVMVFYIKPSYITIIYQYVCVDSLTGAWRLCQKRDNNRWPVPPPT